MPADVPVTRVQAAPAWSPLCHHAPAWPATVSVAELSVRSLAAKPVARVTLTAALAGPQPDALLARTSNW